MPGDPEQRRGRTLGFSAASWTQGPQGGDLGLPTHYPWLRMDQSPVSPAPPTTPTLVVWEVTRDWLLIR